MMSHFRAGRSNKREPSIDLWALAGLMAIFVSGCITLAVIAVALDAFFSWWVG